MARDVVEVRFAGLYRFFYPDRHVFGLSLDRKSFISIHDYAQNCDDLYHVALKTENDFSKPHHKSLSDIFLALPIVPP